MKRLEKKLKNYQKKLDIRFAKESKRKWSVILTGLMLMCLIVGIVYLIYGAVTK